jgi:hypothetical protein
MPCRKDERNRMTHDLATLAPLLFIGGIVAWLIVWSRT